MIKTRKTRICYKNALISIEEKIERIPESGCWIWMRACNDWGYGIVWHLGRVWRVHRLLWDYYKGPIPKGIILCHQCDTPSCCNPHHLFLGTDKTNHADSIKKDRHNRGERHGSARLTPDHIINIRLDKRPNVTIAKNYGVDASLISHIKHGRLWRHI